MASVSSNGATGMGSNNAQVQPALWSYAVPPDEVTPDAASPNGYNLDDYNPNDRSSDPTFRQPLTNHVNGTARPNIRRKNKYIEGLDAEYSASRSLKPPAPIHDHGDISGTTSEADSLLDLYRPSREQLRSVSKGRQNVKKKGSIGDVSAVDDTAQEDVNSKWIHRDKLAKIESRELRDMGAIPGHTLSAKSRSHAGKQSSKAPSLDVDPEAASDVKRQRTVSPTFSNEELVEEEYGQQLAFPDHSTPRSQTTVHGRKSSISKIPVTKSSGLVESSSATQPGSSNQRTIRARSASQTSQNLLDTTNSTPPSGTMRGVTSLATASPIVSQPQSPPRSKLPSKATLPSAARGALRGGRAASGQPRPRTASGPGTGTSSRPGTSSGPRSPEGEPPWIATMYKPDPRLPPDQQMLPTHARRLAREQGTETAMMYETSQPNNSDFMLLDSEGPTDDSPTDFESQDQDLQQGDTQPDMRLHNVPADSSGVNREAIQPDTFQSHQQNDVERREGTTSPYSAENHESNEWPLRSPSDKGSLRDKLSPKSDSASFIHSNARSGTPVLESGYSLMPTIHSPKEIEQRLSQRSGLSNSNLMTNTPTTLQPIRLPEEPLTDEKEKKKGCAACCIVM